MNQEKWCEKLRTHYALTCVINSTLRGQSTSGGAQRARHYIPLRKH
ncbi:hypothetical protein [Paenalcaligenes faecalis]|nr:hypothetical protein [Paenalcaligenes faecalis]